jgi:hypothetical protein
VSAGREKRQEREHDQQPPRWHLEASESQC